MSDYILSLDTSNYTTSAALLSKETGEVISKARLLKVDSGQKGLRQNDAVFLHNKNLPLILEELLKDKKIIAAGVSDKPRNVEGSYMPCFLVGTGFARAVSAALKLPLYYFSHQQGHVAAVLFGAGRLELLHEKIIAFHYSGGTTEALLFENGGEKITILGKTLDISAGQLIDRVGVMLGLSFPCGAELEKLALKAENKIKPKTCVNGRDINLSGLENFCKSLIAKGESKEEIAAFVINSVLKSLEAQTEDILKEYDCPLLYSGGVMSCSIIQKKMKNKFGGIFAPAEFSRDNAVGIAVLTADKTGVINDWMNKKSLFFR